MSNEQLKGQLQAQQKTAGTAVATQVAKPGLIARFADRFGVDPSKMLATLKATAFKVKDGEVSNEQMMGLLIVAEQYRLNPFTKEIFAFPDKKNGIVPVVSVDGWSRILNEHEQLDGFEFVMSPDMVETPDAKPCPAWCEIRIYRKDRSKPTVIREYLDEVYRPPLEGRGSNGPYKITGPWQTHTKRFLRHKTLIQGARVAFGFAGIYDEDEAQRIVGHGSPSAGVIDAEFVEEAPVQSTIHAEEHTESEGNQAAEPGADEAAQDSSSEERHPQPSKPASRKPVYPSLMARAITCKTAEEAAAIGQEAIDADLPADQCKELSQAAAKALSKVGGEQIGSKGARRGGNLG